MTRNLRAAVIGYGVMGKHHARILQNLDGVDFIGIVDPLYENGAQGKTIAFGSISEVVRHGIDYCVIAVPTNLHEQVAHELMDNDISCLIEKPVAHNLDSALRIQEQASAKRLHVAIGHIERFNSALQQAKTRINSGQIGSIYQITTRRQGPFPQRISDVGVVKDLATHDIDLTAWVVDSPYKTVSASAAFRSGRLFEDSICITGCLESNVIVNHVVNWLSPRKDRSVTIMGEHGVLEVDTLSSELKFFENGNIPVSQSRLSHFQGVTQGNVYSYAFAKPEPLQVEHENFRDFLLGRDAKIVSLEDGIRTLLVAEAVIASYKTGSTQYL